MKLKFLPLAIVFLLMGAKWLTAQDLEFVQDTNNYYYSSGDTLFEEIFICQTPYLYQPEVTGGIPSYDITSSAERVDGNVFTINPTDSKQTESFTVTDGNNNTITKITTFFTDVSIIGIPDTVHARTGRYYLETEPFLTTIFGLNIFFDEDSNRHYLNSDALTASEQTIYYNPSRIRCPGSTPETLNYIVSQDITIINTDINICESENNIIRLEIDGGIPPYHIFTLNAKLVMM